MTLDWSRWPNFSERELKCSHTGACEMVPEFMDRLQALRDALGVPLKINSAYRDPTHPAEARKPQPGIHSMGRAVDIKADGNLAYRILATAPALGFTGIGVDATFIHLDDWDGGPRPNVWTY